MHLTPMGWIVSVLCVAMMLTRVVAARIDARRQIEREARMQALLDEQEAIFARQNQANLTLCAACGRPHDRGSQCDGAAS
jgi:hypothetical protein